MQCEKCGSSAMLPKKLFRSSGCLVVAGTVLLVASVSADRTRILIGLVGPGVTRDAVAKRDSQTMAKAPADLRRSRICLRPSHRAGVRGATCQTRLSPSCPLISGNEC